MSLSTFLTHFFVKICWYSDHCFNRNKSPSNIVIPNYYICNTWLCCSPTSLPDCTRTELRVWEFGFFYGRGIVLTLSWHCLGIVGTTLPQQGQDCTTSTPDLRIAKTIPRQRYDLTTTLPRPYQDWATTSQDSTTTSQDWPRLAKTYADCFIKSQDSTTSTARLSHDHVKTMPRPSPECLPTDLRRSHDHHDLAKTVPRQCQDSVKTVPRQCQDHTTTKARLYQDLTFMHCRHIMFVISFWHCMIVVTTLCVC